MNALVQTTTGQYCSFLADLAVHALIDEVNLTPKPALVDQRGSGAHQDLTLQLMERSARSLQPMFEAMAQAALDQGSVSQSLREENPEVARLQSFILPSMRMGMRLILKSLEVKSRTVKLQVT